MSELKPCGMNYFEAGMKLEVMQSEYAHIRKNDAEWEAIETAKEALHEAWHRRAQPANEPLTLEQLRQMDGEPVWIPETEAYFSGYGIVNVKEEKVYQSNEDGDYYPFDEYGSWLAYARKPEGSENE